MIGGLPRRITGNIFLDGRMRRLTAEFTDSGIEFSEGISSSEARNGTLIPAPVNAHTHIGDSFISEEPVGDIAEVFGPAGFKHRELGKAGSRILKSHMGRSIEFMRNSGTGSFVDFREGGIDGVSGVPSVNGISGILLGRPDVPENIERILEVADGISASALSDADFTSLKFQSEAARSAGKLFAIHFGERIREDVSSVIELKPDFLVHCIETTDDDLDAIAEAGIPVTITPRSNIMFGKRPDYARFIEHGIRLMLGTDNCMTVEPDMFSEMSFLYTYQRSMNGISPEDILQIATGNAIDIFGKGKRSDLRAKYILYPDEYLTAYQIVSRGHMWNKFQIDSESH